MGIAEWGFGYSVRALALILNQTTESWGLSTYCTLFRMWTGPLILGEVCLHSHGTSQALKLCVGVKVLMRMI